MLATAWISEMARATSGRLVIAVSDWSIMVLVTFDRPVICIIWQFLIS